MSLRVSADKTTLNPLPISHPHGCQYCYSNWSWNGLSVSNLFHVPCRVHDTLSMLTIIFLSSTRPRDYFADPRIMAEPQPDLGASASQKGKGKTPSQPGNPGRVHGSKTSQGHTNRALGTSQPKIGDARAAQLPQHVEEQVPRYAINTSGLLTCESVPISQLDAPPPHAGVFQGLTASEVHETLVYHVSRWSFPRLVAKQRLVKDLLLQANMRYAEIGHDPRPSLQWLSQQEHHRQQGLRQDRFSGASHRQAQDTVPRAPVPFEQPVDRSCRAPQPAVHQQPSAIGAAPVASSSGQAFSLHPPSVAAYSEPCPGMPSKRTAEPSEDERPARRLKIGAIGPANRSISRSVEDGDSAVIELH